MKIAIEVRDYGTMIAELYPEKAPKTVENFLSLIDRKFFDGLIFHRTIPGFMIQGGGFDEQMNQKHANAIYGEFAANGFPENDIVHTRGVLSMARTMDPNSASSQFFVMHDEAPHLNGQYAAFGQVIEGLEVIDAIATVPTGSYGYHQDVPRFPVIIETVKRLED